MKQSSSWKNRDYKCSPWILPVPPFFLKPKPAFKITETSFHEYSPGENNT